jgi:hypothetical protein
MNFVEYDLENDVGSAFRDGYGGGFWGAGLDFVD